VIFNIFFVSGMTRPGTFQTRWYTHWQPNIDRQ
jgi:hypothetical protein